MWCPGCGSDLPEDAKFCGVCGRPLADEPMPDIAGKEVPAQASSGKPPTQPGEVGNGRRKRLWLIALGLVVVAVLIGVVAVSTLRKPAPPSPDDSALEALREANDGELPEIEYDDDGSLKAIRGPITKAALRRGSDAREALRPISSLIGVTDVDQELEFVGVQRPKNEDPVWWFAFVDPVEPIPDDDSDSDDKDSKQQDDRGKKGIAVSKKETKTVPIPDDVEDIDEDDELPEPSPVDPLVEYAKDLDLRSYTLDYLWQARRADGMLDWRFLVGDGIDEGAPVGMRRQDFDGDGEDELLVVRWADGTNLTMDMVEFSDDGPSVTSFQPDWTFEGSFLGGSGCLDVACDDDGGIIMQWWSLPYPFTDAYYWRLERYEYLGEDEGFESRGAAMAGDAYEFYEFDTLLEQLDDIGAPTAGLEHYRDDTDGLSHELMLSDEEASVELLVRMTAEQDDSLTNDDIRGGISEGDWTSPEHCGTFAIEPNVEQWDSIVKDAEQTDRDSDDNSASLNTGFWFDDTVDRISYKDAYGRYEETFEYTEEDRIASRTITVQSSAEEGSGTLPVYPAHVEYGYDHAGRLERVTISESDSCDGTWTLDYGSNGSMTASFTGKDAQWDSCYVEEERDAKGNLKSRRFRVPMASYTGVHDSQDQSENYSYNAQGQLTSVTYSYSESGYGQSLTAYQEEFVATYDKDDHLEAVDSVTTGHDTTLSRASYTFDSDAHVISCESYSDVNGSKTLVECLYDSQGILSSCVQASAYESGDTRSEATVKGAHDGYSASLNGGEVEVTYRNGVVGGSHVIRGGGIATHPLMPLASIDVWAEVSSADRSNRIVAEIIEANRRLLAS